MRFSCFAAAALVLAPGLVSASTRTPTYVTGNAFYGNKNEGELPTMDDFIWVKDQIQQWITASTCPSEEADLLNHWDRNDDSHPTDCIHFKNERNPNSLGSRLVRQAFHDATGGFDGFVDIYDDPHFENKALEGSFHVLDTIYTTGDVWGDSTRMIKDVVNFADFCAWSFQAALEEAAYRQTGVSFYDHCDDGETALVDCDYVPPIDVKYGRPTAVVPSATDVRYHGADYAVDDPSASLVVTEIPEERFPGPEGPATTGNDLFAYFLENFGFTEREVVTLMGIHTFGGARRTESGYTGMWTQSKNKLNVDYQLGLVEPTPIHCEVQAHGECTMLSTNDKIAADGTCEGHPEYNGRCFGWEQKKVTNGGGIESFGNKFQWRHSCQADGENCTHLMMGVDMAMFRNLEGHICTKQDEIDSGDENMSETDFAANYPVPAAQGNTMCPAGMVKSFPSGSGCPNDGRILATCFEIKTFDADDTSYIEEDSLNPIQWMTNLAPIFQKLLEWDMSNGETYSGLTTLAPDEGNKHIYTSGEECPMCFETNDPATEGVAGKGDVECENCSSGWCTWRKQKGAGFCASDSAAATAAADAAAAAGGTLVTVVSTGETCPDECSDPNNGSNWACAVDVSEFNYCKNGCCKNKNIDGITEAVCSSADSCAVDTTYGGDAFGEPCPCTGLEADVANGEQFICDAAVSVSAYCATGCCKKANSGDKCLSTNNIDNTSSGGCYVTTGGRFLRAMKQ